MVEVPVGGRGQLERSEADVIESFIVNAVCFVSVLDQLVDRQGCVVRFNHGVGYFGGWDYRVGVHNSVRILLADLGDEECSHA